MPRRRCSSVERNTWGISCIGLRITAKTVGTRYGPALADLSRKWHEWRTELELEQCRAGRRVPGQALPIGSARESRKLLPLALSNRHRFVRGHDAGRAVLSYFRGSPYARARYEPGLQPRTEANLLMRGDGCGLEEGSARNLARGTFIRCSNDESAPVLRAPPGVEILRFAWSEPPQGHGGDSSLHNDNDNYSHWELDPRAIVRTATHEKRVVRGLDQQPVAMFEQKSAGTRRAGAQGCRTPPRLGAPPLVEILEVEGAFAVRRLPSPARLRIKNHRQQLTVSLPPDHDLFAVPWRGSAGRVLPGISVLACCSLCRRHGSRIL